MAHSELIDPELQEKESRGMPVDIARVLRALLRGKWLLLGAIVVGGALGFIGAKFLVPSSYVSDGVLKFEGDPTEEQTSLGPSGDLGALADSMQSRPVLSDVQDRLGLDSSVTALKARTVVTNDAQSHTVKVSAGAESPEAAAKLVETLMASFMDYHKERNRSRYESQLETLDQRIAAANANLAAAREDYDQFRSEHGISDLTTEQQREIEAATTSRTEADVANAQIAAIEGRIAQLRRAATSTPAVVTTTSTAEHGEVRRLQGELASLRSRLSDDHPRVQALQQQIQTLRLRIQSGEGTTVASSSASSRRRGLQEQIDEAEAQLEALRAQHTELDAMAESRAQRVAAFSEIEGQATALQARVNVNEALVTELQNERARIEDAVRTPESGFTIMIPATVPDWPERNKSKYIVAAGIPGGLLFLVLLGLLWRELRGLRVRTAREVGYWGKGPVLGTTTWPRDREAVADLVADLDDFAPEAKGKLLVVGATEAEQELAHEIVDQLNNDWFPAQLIDLEAYTKGDAPIDVAPAGGSPNALAKRPANALAVDGPGPTTLDASAWDGPTNGQALRRAARLADRVMVVVTSGAMSAVDLAKIPTRLGRKDGLGYVLVGIEDELAGLPDRAGRVSDFWHAPPEA